MRIIESGLIMVVMACAAAVHASHAHAGPGEDMLRKLDGEWRGRGTARLPGREKEERVTCRLENRWDAAAGTLAVSGQCASSQGKNPVKGQLELKGGEISGSFLGDFDGATPTKSGGVVSTNELVVVTSFINNATGRLNQTRQVIRPSAKGFSAIFYLFDNRTRTFEKSGEMEFTGS